MAQLKTKIKIAKQSELSRWLYFVAKISRYDKIDLKTSDYQNILDVTLFKNGFRYLYQFPIGYYQDGKKYVENLLKQREILFRNFKDLCRTCYKNESELVQIVVGYGRHLFPHHICKQCYHKQLEEKGLEKLIHHRQRSKRPNTRYA